MKNRTEQKPAKEGSDTTVKSADLQMHLDPVQNHKKKNLSGVNSNAEGGDKSTKPENKETHQEGQPPTTQGQAPVRPLAPPSPVADELEQAVLPGSTRLQL